MVVDKRGVHNNLMVNYDVYVVYFIGSVAFASNEEKNVANDTRHLYYVPSDYVTDLNIV